MICINCGNHLSIEKDTICPVCGMNFPLTCNACHEPNPLYARYCWSCGSQLDLGSVGQIEGKETLVEARKKVAVIFADVSGFTALSEKLDPEDVRDIINDCFAYITKPVYELEGTIDKYIGDCVMILFGAKFAHADDARRAVECALKMMERIREYSVERLHDREFNLNISIGVSFGVVVTGKVGNLYDKDFTVMGDIVNTAQRLQSAAGAGNILVSEECRNITWEQIEYSGKKEIRVKNKKDPVSCYHALDIKKDAIASPRLLFGRRDALNQLESHYRTVDGRRYAMITGEPGIGKTSLAGRFYENVLDKSIRKIWITCSMANKSRVNAVVSNIILGMAGLNQNDSMLVKSKGLRNHIGFLMKELGEERMERNFCFLGLAFGLDRSEDFNKVLKSMDYKDILRETEEQLLLFLESSFRLRDHLIVIDDAQWADSSSVSVVRRAVAGSVGKSFVLLASQNQLDGMDEDHVVSLKGLEPDAVKELAHNIFGSSEIDEGLLVQIVEFSHCNPLYIKEYVSAVKRRNKNIVENGHVKTTDDLIGEIPASIENVILSRLSELSNEHNAMLQAAACIGDEFELGWIEGILGLKVDESGFVEKLEEMNIISRKEILVSTEEIRKIHMFNQELTRRVILEGMLHKDKISCYNRLGEMLEQKFGNDMESHYVELTGYFEAAGQAYKATDYAYRAAVGFQRNFNYTSALEFYSTFMRLAGQKREEDERLPLAYKEVGSIYSILGENDKALEHFHKALEGCHSIEETHTIKLMIAEIHRSRAEFDKSVEIIEELENKLRNNSSLYGRLLKLKCTIMKIQGNPDVLQTALASEEILLKNKDYENLSETQSFIGLSYFFDGDTANAGYYLLKGYENAEKIGNLKLIAKLAGNLGIVYHASGRTAKALDFFKKAMEISHEISSMQSYISASMNLGRVYMEKGGFNKAEEYLTAALAKAKSTKAVYAHVITLMNYGDLMYIRGDYEKTEECYQESMVLVDKFGIIGEKAVNFLNIAKLRLKTDNLEKIEELLENAFVVIEKTKQNSDYADYYRLKSILAMRQGALEEAVLMCHRAINHAVETNNDMKHLRALRLKGILCMKTGRADEALKHLEESLKLSEQLESEYESAKGCHYLAKAMGQLGAQERAARYKGLAEEYMNKVDSCLWSEKIKDE